VSDRDIRAGLRGGRVGGFGEGGEESWCDSEVPGEGGTEMELGASWTGSEVEAKSEPRRGRCNFFVCFFSGWWWCDDAGASRIGEKPTKGVEAAVNELD
jgi:hypothetical protein